MKAIPNSGHNPQWSDNLINELSYIRQHLRYQPKLKRLLPAIFSGAFLLLLLITAAVSVYDKLGESDSPATFSIIMLASVLIIFSVSLVRYLQSLKFISISTNYHTSENIVLIQDFLKRGHLAHGQHPSIPEVFQILSRNISAGKKEDREILIFIADDRRILLNSHFTTAWSFFPRTRHHKEMSKMLIHYINNIDRSTGLMHQTF